MTFSNENQDQVHPITLPVSSLSPATTLYTRALAPLGYIILPTATPTTTTNIGLPSTMRTTLILSTSQPGQLSYTRAYDVKPAHDTQQTQKQSRRKKKPHIIFPATTREQVDAFFTEAICAGGDAQNGFEPRKGKEIGVWEAGVRDSDGILLVVRFTGPNEKEEDGDGDRKSIAETMEEAQEPVQEKGAVEHEEDETSETQDSARIELWRQDVASKRAALSTSASDVSVSESESDSDIDAYVPHARQGPGTTRTTRYIYHYPRPRSDSPPSSASSHPSLKLSSYKHHTYADTRSPDENTTSQLPPRRHSSNTSATHIKTAVLGATAALALSYIFNSPSSSAVSSSGARKESAVSGGREETRGIDKDAEQDRGGEGGRRREIRAPGRRHTLGATQKTFYRTYTRPDMRRNTTTANPYIYASKSTPTPTTTRTRTNACNTPHKAANRTEPAEDRAGVDAPGKRDETTLYRTRMAPQARAQTAWYPQSYEQRRGGRDEVVREREKEGGRERERERWGRGERW